ncbi:MAG: hemerythrin [Candidatus Electrothrix sp. AR3]|nr:hemerythrin [Candidatus Electrothrix sp. AR3]
MSLITWDESFSVQIRVVDQQHQKLIDIINDLHDAMKAGHGKDVLSTILIELINYTGTHFTTEEQYFTKFNYPDTSAHKKEHVDFVQRVLDFKEEFENGRMTVSIELLYFLRDWLMNHIKVSDKKYSEFFHAKGLK